uniref:Transposase n=1 Tax=Heterorhabditis bacteriophora TaxID=37862 RepID=A0A1I7X2M6_HETBA
MCKTNIEQIYHLGVRTGQKFLIFNFKKIYVESEEVEALGYQEYTERTTMGVLIKVVSL